MSDIQIKVERDSVCAGDDVQAPHSYSFKLPENALLIELFSHLEKKRYLALVAGVNHSWEAMIDKKPVAVFKGNSKSPEQSKFLTYKTSKFAKNGQVNVYFKYNSAST